MSIVEITHEQMEAIKDQRDHFEQHLSSVLRKLGDRNCKFVDKSEPINNMSVEQIVMAWHGHVEISPNYVSFDEAMKALKEGKSVKFNNNNWFNSANDLEDGNISLYTDWSELLEGEWQIKD